MYLFGFGSLININSAQKSFQRVLKQEDLIPVQIKGFQRVWNALESIKFDGIEVWHPSADDEMHTWLEMAKTYKLLTSGGSDFHGDNGRFPKKLGDFSILYKDVKSMIEYK